MKKDLSIKKYISIIQVTIFMLCISSVCMAAVVEFTDEATFKSTAGDPQYFVDFETYGNGTPVVGQPTISGNEWSNLGIQFAPVESGESLSLNNSAYVSPTRSLIVSGDASSYVITFTPSVESFGVYFVDSDYTSPSEQIVLKDSGGNTLGVFAIPPSPANSSAFRGYASDIPIAEVLIIEDTDGEAVLLDNVIYSFSEPAWVEMEWVIVGDAGNPNDVHGDGYGAIDYVYRIGKYEVTVGQYTEFFNAVAVTDTYGLYNTNMWSHGEGCKIQQSGSSGSYTYSVAADDANRPVNYISWYDTLRFTNWLHNGQPTGAQDDSTTEDGAYDMSLGSSVVRKVGAKVWLPSEDEWYKAAYHKNDGVTGNYFDYPTSSDSVPSNELVEPIDPGNNATFYDNSWTIGSPKYRTEFGAHENSDSPYGTFDMGGNVWEWNEALVYGSGRGLRGGSYHHNDEYLRSSFRSYDSNPNLDAYGIGFRVASGTVLVSPNGGETFISGTTQKIGWFTPAPADANVLLEYSVNDGLNWVTVDANTKNDGEYDWLVPEVTSSNCLVRVTEVLDSNFTDTSDDVFTIYVCQLSSIGQDADLDDNCKIDFNDFSIWSQQWLNNGNPFDVYDLYEYNGHHYALTLIYDTWQEAEDEAVSFGGHLVTINDGAEDMWLYGTFHSSSESVWIGLYQDHDHPEYSEPAGGWVWISGEPVTYTGWGGDEPNNGYGSGEDYGAFHTAGWYWNDLPPDYTGIRGGIIEVPW